MDVCNDGGGLTFAQEPEGNELGVAQVDDLCGKMLSTRNEGERRGPLTLVEISWIHGGRKRFTRGGGKKAQVSNSSIGMGRREEGILLRASSERVESVNTVSNDLRGCVSHDPSGPVIS